VLGRSTGLSDEKLDHLLDEPLPDGIYDDIERAVIAYARRSTLADPIDDDLYAELRRHFDERVLIELWATVGLSNVVNRFHATFHTDVDEYTLEALAQGDTPPDWGRDF